MRKQIEKGAVYRWVGLTTPPTDPDETSWFEAVELVPLGTLHYNEIATPVVGEENVVLRSGTVEARHLLLALKEGWMIRCPAFERAWEL